MKKETGFLIYIIFLMLFITWLAFSMKSAMAHEPDECLTFLKSRVCVYEKYENCIQVKYSAKEFQRLSVECFPGPKPGNQAYLIPSQILLLGDDNG